MMSILAILDCEKPKQHNVKENNKLKNLLFMNLLSHKMEKLSLNDFDIKCQKNKYIKILQNAILIFINIIKIFSNLSANRIDFCTQRNELTNRLDFHNQRKIFFYQIDFHT